MLSCRGLCDELITRPEESYRLCCAVVCDLETSRMGAPYIYDVSHLRVKRQVINLRSCCILVVDSVETKHCILSIRVIRHVTQRRRGTLCRRFVFLFKSYGIHCDSLQELPCAIPWNTWLQTDDLGSRVRHYFFAS